MVVAVIPNGRHFKVRGDHLWSTHSGRHSIGSHWNGQHIGLLLAATFARGPLDQSIKGAPLPRLPPPAIHPDHHICLDMEAVKGFLAPLGLNVDSIQDTLVCILYTALIRPGY